MQYLGLLHELESTERIVHYGDDVLLCEDGAVSARAKDSEQVLSYEVHHQVNLVKVFRYADLLGLRLDFFSFASHKGARIGRDSARIEHLV